MATIGNFTMGRGTYSWNKKRKTSQSFLQLSMLNGWGGYVLTEANSVNAFFSHDEYIDFFGDEDANLADIRKSLARPRPAV